MKSTIIKSLFALMALGVTLSAPAQITFYTYGEDNPLMVIRNDVRAIPSLPEVALMDSLTRTRYIPTFKYNIYYGGDYFAKDDSIGILICDNCPEMDYDFVPTSSVIDVSDPVKNYITKGDNDIFCEIRTCYYDSVAEMITPVAERKQITQPIIVRGVQLGDTIYCYDGMRFLAKDLDTIPCEPSMWIVVANDNVVKEYHVCDNTTSLSKSPTGAVFEGFEHNGIVYEVNGVNDKYGIEITPMHNISDVEKIDTTTLIPLEYGTGKKIELADGSKIKILPLKKGKYSADTDSKNHNYVMYIYPYNEDGSDDFYTVLGNVAKTANGYDISEAGFIYVAESIFDTDGVINENGKLLSDAWINSMNGRCTYYYSWCENYPILFESIVSSSIGWNNLSHFSNFSSTSINWNISSKVLIP